MRIVKQGEIPPDLVLEGTCEICESEVEALRGELWTNNHQNIATGMCPLCKTGTIHFTPKEKQ